MRELDYRPPLATRILALGACGGFIVFVAISLVVATARHQDVSGAPMAIGMALFAGTLGYRLAGLSCHARSAGIVIHNYWRTRRIAISQIDGLDVGRASAGNLWTVRVLTNGVAIPIDVLGVSGFILGRKPGGAVQRLEQ